MSTSFATNAPDVTSEVQTLKIVLCSVVKTVATPVIAMVT